MTHRIALLATLAFLTACGDDTTAPNAAVSGEVARLLSASEATPASLAEATRFERDEDFDCRGVVTGRFTNVYARSGQSCTLTGAIVRGNIVAEPGARLFVYETTTGGNIDAAAAAQLHVRGGRLEGSIQAQDGVSRDEVGIRIYGGTVLSQGNISIQKMNTGVISITDAVLEKGNIQVQENTTGLALELLRNRVAQNVEVFVNRGAGSKAVVDNSVSQKLSCKDNVGPFTGGPNRAGDVEGQCRR